MNTLSQLTLALKKHIATTFSIQLYSLPSITISLTTDEAKHAFGDITLNAAMVLSKTIGKNPREIATKIVETFSHPLIEKLEIAGPGFINVTFTLQAAKQLLLELTSQQEQFFKLDTNDQRSTYSVEFVSANPTGPLHLGHGRGGIIGDVLANILKFIGNTAIKEFYINDAGSQIQKLGASFKARVIQALGHDAQVPEDGYQGHYLVDLAEQLIKSEGQEVLNKPDSFFSNYAKNALLENLRATLLKYGIDFDVWFSEKSLHDSGAVKAGVETLTNRGYTYELDGAIWFKSTEFGDDKDRVLIKNTGEYTYVAADIAYLQNKVNRNAQKIIMILGQDHHSYVVRMKGIAAALGYNPDMLDIILYQLVTLKESGEAVRMSKRAGKIVSLHEVIDLVGADVARFFYLHRKADAHLDFDLDLALKNTDENPVYYAQYAYVRTQSILEKALKMPDLENLTNADVDGLTVHEKLLLKKIVSLKELLESISKNYQTHLLTYYVLELAQLFHKYYNDNRVIDLENVKTSRARLMVIQSLKNTFETVFKLLEISRPASM